MKIVARGMTIALLLAMLATTSAFALVEREPWYPPEEGYPDPFACAQYDDCDEAVIEVCIEGVTYEVGVYFDPASMTPEEIAENALGWSGIVLTVGACQPVPYFPCRQVEYGDTLDALAVAIFGNILPAYTDGLVSCTSAVGDWGQNCHRIAEGEILLRGQWICPAPPPDTGE